MKNNKAVMLFLSLLLSGNAMSSNLNADKNFYLMTNGSPLVEILNDFSLNYNLPVIISKHISGDYTGEIKSQSAIEFLKKISDTESILWYFDGNAVFVYNKEELSNEILTPSFIDASKIISAASTLKLSNKDTCILKKLHEYNAIDITGVPKCFELLKNLQINLDKESQSNVKNKEVVRIFKLKNTSATDITYSYRNEKVIIPGVAVLLNNILKAGTLPTNEKLDTSFSGFFLNGSAQITADPRQNAIIVKDREITMPLYEEIIQALDVKQKQIEVTVSIIDVNEDDLDTLGINWSGSFSIGGVGLSFNNTAANGTNIGSSVINNANEFMFKLNALESSSKAKILSQPSIITLDNMEAIIDKSTTFYTKLIGDKNSSLEEITSGTLLKVTPRILHSGNDNDN